MGKKRRISNKAIVWIKLVTALVLFFSCCLFFFQNIDIFGHDLRIQTMIDTSGDPMPWEWWYMIFPIFFILGVCFIISYVTNMVFRMENKTVWKADRMYVLYQIVFVLVLAVTVWRWFLVNLSNSPIPSAIMILCGIVTLFTPKIVDNDNNEF